MNKKEISAKANIIVKQLDTFCKSNIIPELKINNEWQNKLAKDVHEIFLTGAWYGAYKAIQCMDKEKK